MTNHLKYLHYNPVNYGLVTAPSSWEYSSFHLYVKAGIYEQTWGSSERLIFDSNIGKKSKVGWLKGERHPTNQGSVDQPTFPNNS